MVRCEEPRGIVSLSTYSEPRSSYGRTAGSSQHYAFHSILLMGNYTYCLLVTCMIKVSAASIALFRKPD
jgi:hypothetical protein